MSQRDDWNESTPPRGPATIAILRAAAAGAKQAHERINSLDEGFGRVLAELGQLNARIDRLDDEVTTNRGEMKRGFDRIGSVLDDVRADQKRDMRRVEDSQHDLSAEVAKAKRIAMLKNVSWPTALVVCVMVICYCTLLALNIQPPTWLVGLVGAIGTAIAGVLPALLGQDKS